MLKMIIVPRQARDKHRESTQTETRFGGTSGGSVRMLGSGVYEMWYSGAKMRKNSRILPREVRQPRRFFIEMCKSCVQKRRVIKTGSRQAQDN